MSILLSSAQVESTPIVPFDQDQWGKPRLPADDAEAIYAFGHLIRKTEELLLELFSHGKVSGTTHTCLGQELCQMAVVRALSDPGDVVLSNHRNHGHFLTYSGDFAGLVAEVMGREAGVCGGRGGSQHLAFRHFHSNGVQGGLTAIGAGHALGRKLRSSTAVTAIFIGDGTLGQGLVYEALNLSAIWKVRALFVVENNRIAQTTPTACTIGGDILARGSAFGLRCWNLDDAAPDFFEQAEEVVRQMRSAGQPGFLVIDTRRLGPHSKGDDLRPVSEMEAIRRRDPLMALGERLAPDARARIDLSNAHYLAQVAEAAERSPEARFDQPPRHVYRHREPAAVAATPAPAGANVRTAINEALRRLLETDPRVLVLGEDLHEPYGGAFKVTARLSAEFPGRVVSTPISEAAIVGSGIGLALDGFRPIVEVMFADFLTLSMDQIYNHAVKFAALFPHHSVPLVIRTPGGGRRGYGPTHSQSPEHWATSIPGLTVVFGSHRHDNGALLENATLRWPHPTLFLEHKLLYSMVQDPGAYTALEAHAEDPGADLFPTLVRGESACPDITLVTYGGMAPVAEEVALALEDEELGVEIVLPSLLSPLPGGALVSRLKQRKRVAILEESHSDFGPGAEIVARMAESGFAGTVLRIGTPPVPIPSARSLEAQVIPQTAGIVERLLRLF